MKRTRVSSASDVLDAIETARAERDVSMRALSQAAEASPSTYYMAQRNGGMRLATAITILGVLGYRMEIVRERRP